MESGLIDSADPNGEMGLEGASYPPRPKPLDPFPFASIPICLQVGLSHRGHPCLTIPGERQGRGDSRTGCTVSAVLSNPTGFINPQCMPRENAFSTCLGILARGLTTSTGEITFPQERARAIGCRSP